MSHSILRKQRIPVVNKVTAWESTTLIAFKEEKKYFSCINTNKIKTHLQFIDTKKKKYIKTKHTYNNFIMSRQTVLRLGDIRYAQSKWTEFQKTYDVISINSEENSNTTRESFISDLKSGKYDHIVGITRTFNSVSLTGRFDKELIDALPPNVKFICHNGAGYDQVDASYCATKKIQVGNVPHLVNDPTSDTHVFLLLGALRNFKLGLNSIAKGQWNAGCSPGFDPVEKPVVGVLGLGGIGRDVVKKLKPFGFEKFYYHNRNRLSEELEQGCEWVSFDDLLAKCDIINVCIPLNPNTKHILNKAAFEKMKDGVIIVNTARGAVIDEAEITKQLKSGKVAAFGTDVFEHEPNVTLENNELISMDNVFALPHLGTNTFNTIKKMEEDVVDNALGYLKSEKLVNLVPEMKGTFY